MGWPREANGSKPSSSNDMLLGQLLERSNQTLWWLRRMDGRLETGDDRMTQIEVTIARHSVRHESHEEEIKKLRTGAESEKRPGLLKSLHAVLEKVQALQWWAVWGVIIVLSLTGYIAPAELKTLAVKWVENHYSVTPEGQPEHLLPSG